MLFFYNDRPSFTNVQSNLYYHHSCINQEVWDGCKFKKKYVKEDVLKTIESFHQRPQKLVSVMAIGDDLQMDGLYTDVLS